MDGSDEHEDVKLYCRVTGAEIPHDMGGGSSRAKAREREEIAKMKELAEESFAAATIHSSALKKEKADEIRKMSIEDIEKEVAKTQRSLFDKKFQKYTSGIEKTHELRVARKQIARLLTVYNEKKNEVQS